jgi:ribose 5-phosphate isomerase A
MNIDQLKKQAAEKAVEDIKDGMIVGLGSGSTVFYALEKISEKLKSGELKNIIGISSSTDTEKKAVQFGIPLTTFNDNPIIDLTIDGADEADPELNLIKGGGGALLREKIIAQASKKLIIIIDETKLSDKLGEKWAVPIEVLQFAMNSEKLFLESLGAKISLRKKNGETFITDEGNIIIDANFGVIEDVKKLTDLINQRAGIVEHGIFAGMTDKIIYAGRNGEIVVIKSNFKDKNVQNEFLG